MRARDAGVRMVFILFYRKTREIRDRVSTTIIFYNISRIIYTQQYVIKLYTPAIIII